MKNLVRALMLSILLIGTFATQSLAQSCTPSNTTYFNYFNGSYAPSTFRPCQGRNQNKYVFGNDMKWNQTRRNGVQDHVRQGRRYTHDITDLSGNLGYHTFWGTNFPNPVFDTDDDDRNGSHEETEVTVNDTAFPVVSRNYYFYVQMAQPTNNAGTVSQTPAVSRYYFGAWQTSYFSNAFNQSYTRWRAASRGSVLEDLLDNGEKIFEVEQSETVDVSQPLSIEEFKAQIDWTQRPLLSFVLEYEVETEDGPQIVTIGGVPNEKELIPSDGLEEMLSNFPDTYKITSFRGVVSYKLGNFIGDKPGK